MSLTVVHDQMDNILSTIEYMDITFLFFLVFLSISQTRIQVPFNLAVEDFYEITNKPQSPKTKIY